MQDKEVIAFEADRDLLSQTSYRLNLPSDKRLGRGIHGTEYERTHDPDRFQRLIQNPCLEGLDINDDIRKFGHGSKLLAAARAFECG